MTVNDSDLSSGDNSDMSLKLLSSVTARLRDRGIITRKRVAAASVAMVVIVLVLAARMTGGSASIATHPVERGEFIMDVRTEGELQAKRSVSVNTPARGWGQMRIMQIVEDGVMVEEGAFLAQFDPSDAQNNLLEAQNALETARADFLSTEANVESQAKELENTFLTQQYSYEQAKLRFELMKYEAEAKRREQELEFKKSELSLQQAKEKIETQKIIDEANLSKAELRVKQAEQRLDERQEQLDSLTLTAPKSGMVVLQKVWGPNGREKVKVGSTPYRGMELIRIPDLSTMLVSTTVNEIDISVVALGQRVVIAVDAVPGPTFYGSVTSIATLARNEEGSDLKVFDVEVTIEGSDDRLKPGMSAQCTVVTNTVGDVLYVPQESVFDKEDTTVVYVKGTAGFDVRTVELGSRNSDYVIVTGGLEAGDEVALRDPTLPLEDIGVEADSGNSNGNSGRGGALPL
jgi:HlyD family secretion protein